MPVSAKMKEVIEAKRKTGNKGAITKKDAELFGVGEVDFKRYTNAMGVLYENAFAYAKLQRIPTSKSKELSEAKNTLFSCYKNILLDICGKEIKVRAEDANILSAYAVRFALNKRDGKKYYDESSVTRFRREVETDLGLRIEDLEYFITPEGKIYTDCYKRIEKSFARSETSIERLNADIKRMRGMIDKFGSNTEIKKELEKGIADAEEEIKKFESKQEELKKSFDELDKAYNLGIDALNNYLAGLKDGVIICSEEQEENAEEDADIDEDEITDESESDEPAETSESAEER